ncbi:MAG: hypothetical protein LBE20_02840 [Deltaproteobacteria bacterium]|jgi:hypothetical protein|nr:hypothetical protein [Deltaproteobacteria bacterium]
MLGVKLNKTIEVLTFTKFVLKKFLEKLKAFVIKTGQCPSQQEPDSWKVVFAWT